MYNSSFVKSRAMCKIPLVKTLHYGQFSVNLRPPVVTNLFSLLNILFREWGGGGGGGGLWGISKVNIMDALLVVGVLFYSPEL